jgi:hypothetical protein
MDGPGGTMCPAKTTVVKFRCKKKPLTTTLGYALGLVPSILSGTVNIAPSLTNQMSQVALGYHLMQDSCGVPNAPMWGIK